VAKVSVVYHSGYGHTKVIAEAVVRGAQSVAGTQVELVSVEEAESHWGTLEAADAIIFGTPTYMGSVSGPFKMFMDASAKVWFEQKWKDKLAAGFQLSGRHDPGGQCAPRAGTGCGGSGHGRSPGQARRQGCPALG